MCPHCGFVSDGEHAPHVLIPGTILNGKYLLGEVIGQGGFGITYIGRDLMLDMRVAVKEYFPSGFANRNVSVSDRISITSDQARVDAGKERFLKEAQVLAKFHGTPGVVDVRDFFEGNNTAYIVMEYLEGEDLAHRLKKRLFAADEIFRLMEPVLDTLEKIHQQGVIHRDISPDNIMMLTDGSLKLMDFGAARTANFDDQRTISVVLKAKYAPIEQYRSHGKQGPWTDIYALCATIYKCITGITPDDALERAFRDEVKWPSEMGIAITREQEWALKKGLAVYQKDRLKNVRELKEALREGFEGSAETEAGARREGGATADAETEATLTEPEGQDEVTSYLGTKAGDGAEDAVPGKGAAPQKPIPQRKPFARLWPIPVLVAVAAALALLLPRGHKGAAPAETNQAETVATAAPSDVAVSAKTVVPDLAGMTLEEAAQRLLQARLGEAQVEEAYSQAVESGRVIDQSVAPGQEVEEGAILTLKVSKGEAPFQMPKVVLLEEEEARQTLEAMGIEVSVEYVQHEAEKIGTVISQEPASSTEIRAGDSARIVVAAALREIPNVSGERAEDAQRKLEEAGFRVTWQESYSDATAQGRIISQTPAAGAKQLTGSTVVLMVCQKSEEGTACYSPEEQFDYAFWLNGSGWEHCRMMHESQTGAGEFLVYEHGGICVLFTTSSKPIPDLDKELRRNFDVSNEEATSWSNLTDILVHDKYAGRMTENYTSSGGEIYYRCYAAWNTETRGYIVSFIAERAYDHQAKAACEGILDSFMTGGDYALAEPELPEMLEVPDVVGMEVNKAQATLRAKGFASWTYDAVSSTVGKGVVLSQEMIRGVLPEGFYTAGVLQQKGSLVFLTVSIGQG